MADAILFLNACAMNEIQGRQIKTIFRAERRILQLLLVKNISD